MKQETPPTPHFVGELNWFPELEDRDQLSKYFHLSFNRKPQGHHA